jgi:small-conductance mechanosensitive channel
MTCPALSSLRRSAVVVLLYLAISLAGTPVLSQTSSSASGSSPNAAPASETERIEALEDLIVSIESATGRERLLIQLKTLLEVQRNEIAGRGPESAGKAADTKVLPQAGILDAVANRARDLGVGLLRGAGVVAQLPDLLDWVRGQLDESESRARWMDTILKISAAIAVALSAEILARRLLRHSRGALKVSAADRPLVRIATFLGLLAVELGPLAVFWIAAEFSMGLLNPQADTLVVVRLIVAATVIVRAILAVARALLIPTTGEPRLVPVDDETASYAYVWVRRFISIGVYGFLVIAALAMLGLSPAGQSALQLVLMLVLTGLAAAFILQLREPVRRHLGGDRTGFGTASFRTRLADVWHVLAIIYVLGLLGVWLLRGPGGLLDAGRATGQTILVIAVALLVEASVNRLLRRFFSLNDETRAHHPGLEERAGRYLPIVHGILRVAIWFVAIVVFTDAWGFDSFAWLTSPAGRGMIGSAVQIGVIVLLAIFVHEASSAAIQRYIERSQGEAGRLRTLLPLLRNAIRVAVVLIAGLVVLSALGLNIAPLLAGAGVVGLAIGFGSQKLVQDIINGIFIMIENTISIGDVVKVGGHTGVCEAITIRTISLRDQAGTVFTVPFNEVTVVENLTKDFSYAVMDVGVAYRENTDQVIEVLQEVAETLRADDAYRAVMLEPLEVLGVDAFADSAVIIKVRLKTLPIKQWMVKREFNRRMKMEFDKRGIEIPFPHQTIFFGENKGGGAPPVNVTLCNAAKADRGTQELGGSTLYTAG